MDPKTRDILKTIYSRYHKPQYLGLDPVQYVREFEIPADTEIAGLLASSLAYGRVETIRENIRRVFKVTGKNLVDFVCSTRFSRKQQMLRHIRHRFNCGFDLALLFECLKKAIQTSGSIQAVFLQGMKPEHGNIARPLDEFALKMRAWAIKIAGTSVKPFEYFFPLPREGSACKRLNMYLRWMIRKNDGIDMGIWGSVSPAMLVMPVDTHVACLAGSLGLSTRRTADWRMAEEITGQLKKIDPDDPVKYDFSLCRAGMSDFRSCNKRKKSRWN
jgi:uncharacterized protein (TIGR02757 family)